MIYLDFTKTLRHRNMSHELIRRRTWITPKNSVGDGGPGPIRKMQTFFEVSRSMGFNGLLFTMTPNWISDIGKLLIFVTGSVISFLTATDRPKARH
jgi:hypothetical protein